MTPAVCPHCEKDVLAIMAATGSTLLAERVEEVPVVALDGRVSFGRRMHDCSPGVAPAFVELSVENAREVAAVPRGRLWPHHFDGFIQTCREAGTRHVGEGGHVRQLVRADRASAFAEILRSRGIEVRGAVL